MQYWDVLLDALVDTAKILPILFIVYYLIELIEYKCALKFQNNKFLKGKASPVVGAALGCVPQCGFSVVSTDLFSRGSLSVGALIAVYIATSDEALPLMLSNPSSFVWLLVLIGLKIVLAILIGYLSMWLYKIIFNNKKQPLKSQATQQTPSSTHSDSNENIIEEHTHEENIDLHGGCCHHHVESKSFDWVHPLLHCLKICAFILIINVVFGFITQIWIGEEALTNFLAASRAWQPVLTILIGLIPNCASSVVITELFLMGGLSFGSLLAGLMVNAGLGLTILLKQNKNWKENLFIIILLVISSLIVGYLFNFI